MQRVRFGIGIEQHRIGIARTTCDESEDVSSRARVECFGGQYLPRRRQQAELRALLKRSQRQYLPITNTHWLPNLG